jgi:hypothetical protein
MQPTGLHELIGGFLVEELTIEIRRQKLPYSILRNCLLKPHLLDSGLNQFLKKRFHLNVSMVLPGYN